MGSILAEMVSLFFFNGSIKYLLCVIDVFIIYAWVNHLTDKKAEKVLVLKKYRFAKTLNKPKRKPNSLLVNQGREF